MRKLTYLAVFEPTSNGYSVYFPDLPGCVSFGETIETAQKAASEALGLHIYGMEQDYEALPEATTAPAIDPATTAGYILSPVTVYPDVVKNELDNRRVKTNVTIPAWLKEIAEKEDVNYSRLLEIALVDYLGIQRH